MRYYPLDKDCQFYVEALNKSKTYETCTNYFKTLKRRKKNICGTNPCMHIVAPEKSKTPKGKKRKKKKKPKKPKKGKGGKGKADDSRDFGDTHVYDYQEPDLKVCNFWKDCDGTKIEHISNKDLHFKDWLKTRKKHRTKLPVLYEGTRFIQVLKKPPTDFLYPFGSYNLFEIRTIVKKEKAEAKAKALALKKIRDAEIALEKRRIEMSSPTI